MRSRNLERIVDAVQPRRHVRTATGGVIRGRDSIAALNRWRLSAAQHTLAMCAVVVMCMCVIVVR